MKPENKKLSPKAKSPTVKKRAATPKKKTAAKSKIAAKKTAKTPAAKAKAAKTRTTIAPPARANTVKTAARTTTRAIGKIKAVPEEPIAKTKPALRAARKTPMQIPAILLEGDAPVAPTPSGPGQRYSLGPTPPHENFSAEGDLPEAYGTEKLLLTARDPHWLYAHWDLTAEQLRSYNARSDDGHLVVRVYKNELAGKPESQVHVHPESRNWFVHVADVGSKYLAELGYYSGDEGWVRISASGATFTPPDSLSEDTSVRFATIPIDVPFESLIQIVKAAARESIPLAEAIMQLRAEGFKNLPKPSEFVSTKWTSAQETALGSIITMDSVRRVWIGSLEITELIRRQLMQGISSAGVAQFSLPSSVSVSSLSSPLGGIERRKGFWFNVNAELIIYGATEPDAKVTIGGRKIQLRSDGTFSFRFILPDGNYDLPAQATSADGDDSRSAHLKFSRGTNYNGEVGAHPQDSQLKTPEVANVA